MPLFSSSIKKIRPFTFLDVTYTHQVGEVLYADTLDAAEKGLAAFQALSPRMQQFYSYHVKTNGLLVCLIDAQGCTSDPTRAILGQWTMIADRDRPRIAGRATDVDGLYDNIVIRVAAGKELPVLEVAGTLAHEGEHHYWFVQNLTKSYPNDKRPLFLSDPMALRRLHYYGKHLPRSEFYKAFFEDFRQYLNVHGTEAWLTNDFSQTRSSAHTIFNNPTFYFRRVITEAIKNQFDLSEVSFSIALTRKIHDMLLEGEAKPSEALMTWLHQKIAQHPFKKVDEIDRKLRPILDKAWKLMRTEIVAHISDAFIREPDFVLRYVPNTLAVLDKISKSTHRPLMVRQDVLTTPPTPLDSSLVSEINKARAVPSKFPLFTNTHSVDGVRMPQVSLSINPKVLSQDPSKTYLYVVTDEGQLLIAEHRLQGTPVYHPDLHPGPVAGAGEFYFSNGQWVINNKSGHFLPRGAHIESLTQKVFKSYGFKNTTFIPVNGAWLQYIYGESKLPNNLVFRDSKHVWRNASQTRLIASSSELAAIIPEVLGGAPRSRVPAVVPKKPIITLELKSAPQTTFVRAFFQTVRNKLLGLSYAQNVLSEYRPDVYDNPRLAAVGLGTAKFGAHLVTGGAVWKTLGWGAIPFELATLVAACSPDLDQRFAKESEGLEQRIIRMRAEGATLNEIRQEMQAYYQMHPYADPREVGGAIAMQKRLNTVNVHQHIEGAFDDFSAHVNGQKQQQAQDAQESSTVSQPLDSAAVRTRYNPFFNAPPIQKPTVGDRINNIIDNISPTINVGSGYIHVGITFGNHNQPIVPGIGVGVSDEFISDLINRTLCKEKKSGSVVLYGRKYGYSFEGRFWNMSLHVYQFNDKGHRWNFSDRVSFKLKDYTFSSENNIPIINAAIAKALQPYVQVVFNQDNHAFFENYKMAVQAGDYPAARTLVNDFKTQYTGVYPEFEADQQRYDQQITLIENENNAFKKAYTDFFQNCNEALGKYDFVGAQQLVNAFYDTYVEKIKELEPEREIVQQQIRDAESMRTDFVKAQDDFFEKFKDLIEKNAYVAAKDLVETFCVEHGAKVEGGMAEEKISWLQNIAHSEILHARNLCFENCNQALAQYDYEKARQLINDFYAIYDGKLEGLEKDKTEILAHITALEHGLVDRPLTWRGHLVSLQLEVQKAQVITDGVFFGLKQLSEWFCSDPEQSHQIQQVLEGTQVQLSGILQILAHYQDCRIADALCLEKGLEPSTFGLALAHTRYAFLGAQLVNAGVRAFDWKDYPNVMYAVFVANHYVLPTTQLALSLGYVLTTDNFVAGALTFSPEVVLKIPEVQNYLLAPNPESNYAHARFVTGQTLKTVEKNRRKFLGKMVDSLGYVRAYHDPLRSWVEEGLQHVVSKSTMRQIFAFLDPVTVLGAITNVFCTLKAVEWCVAAYQVDSTKDLKWYKWNQKWQRQQRQQAIYALYLKNAMSGHAEVGEVALDGNCLFAALAYYVPYTPQQLRSMAVTYIRNNPRVFNTPFFIEDTLEEHIAKMAQEGTWGTNAEIYSLAQVLNRPIIVILPAVRNLGFDKTHPDMYALPGDPIYLILDNNHYRAFLPRQEAYFELGYRESLAVKGAQLLEVDASLAQEPVSQFVPVLIDALDAIAVRAKGCREQLATIKEQQDRVLELSEEITQKLVSFSSNAVPGQDVVFFENSGLTKEEQDVISALVNGLNL